MKKVSTLIPFVLLLGIAFLTACAPPSMSSGNMTLASPLNTVPLEKTVSVEVAGGAPTALQFNHVPMATDFRQAMLASVEKSGVFERVVTDDSADYQLYILFIRGSYPAGGSDIEILTESYWKLSDKSGNTIWEKSYVSKTNGGIGTSFNFAKRVVKLSEESIRNFTADALTEISKLQL